MSCVVMNSPAAGEGEALRQSASRLAALRSTSDAGIMPISFTLLMIRARRKVPHGRAGRAHSG
jgi:hypothetical protein